MVCILWLITYEMYAIFFTGKYVLKLNLEINQAFKKA